MLLRRAVPCDEQAVAEVHVGSWQVAYRGLLPSGFLDRLDPAERAKRYSFGNDHPGATPTAPTATRRSGRAGALMAGW